MDREKTSKYIIPMGKYKGEYLEDVYSRDQSYVTEFMQNLDGQAGHMARRYLKMQRDAYSKMMGV